MLHQLGHSGARLSLRCSPVTPAISQLGFHQTGVQPKVQRLCRGDSWQWSRLGSPAGSGVLDRNQAREFRLVAQA
jgi:hypothetical protein